MAQATYIVTGMTCEHCVRSITEEIGEVDGVDTVDVELASGEVTVTSTHELPDDRLRAAVEAAGYQLASTTSSSR